MFLLPWKVRALMGAVFVLVLTSVQSFGQTTSPMSPPPSSSPTQGGTVNNPPVLLSLGSRQVPGQKYRIYGRVADETPVSCGVVISGAASGVALCDENGNFDAVFNVTTVGSIYAVVGDGQLQSQASTITLTNAAPTVGMFMTVQGANNTWTFSGTVGDEACAGLTVTLSGPSGVQGSSALVLANGTWSITVTVPPGTGGNVSATISDWYGLLGVAYTTF